MAGRKGKTRPKRRATRRAPERPSEPPAPGAVRGRPFPRGHTVGFASRFQPGQTGNPGGIPRDVKEFRELMRSRTIKALDRVDDVLDHGSEEGILKAAREVWANGWGRPTQPISGEGGGPMRITYDDVRTRVTAAAVRVAGGLPTGEEDGDDDDAGDGNPGDAGVRPDKD